MIINLLNRHKPEEVIKRALFKPIVNQIVFTVMIFNVHKSHKHYVVHVYVYNTKHLLNTILSKSFKIINLIQINDNILLFR